MPVLAQLQLLITVGVLAVELVGSMLAITALLWGMMTAARRLP